MTMPSNAQLFAIGEDRSNMMRIDEGSWLPPRQGVRDLLKDEDQYRVPVSRNGCVHGLSKHLSGESLEQHRGTSADSSTVGQQLWRADHPQTQRTGNHNDTFDTDEERGEVTTASGFSDMSINQEKPEAEAMPFQLSKTGAMRAGGHFDVQQPQEHRGYIRETDLAGKSTFSHSYSDYDASSDGQDDLDRLVGANSFQPLDLDQNEMLLEEVSGLERVQRLSYRQNQRDQRSLLDQHLDSKSHIRPQYPTDLATPASRREVGGHDVQTSLKDRGEQFTQMHLSGEPTDIENAAHAALAPKLKKRTESHGEASRLQAHSDLIQSEAVAPKQYFPAMDHKHRGQHFSLPASFRSTSRCRDNEVWLRNPHKRSTSHADTCPSTPLRLKGSMGSVKAFHSQELDYGVHELSTMAYENLQSEAFEGKSSPTSCALAGIQTMTPTEKLDHLKNLAGPGVSSQRQDILASLSLLEYISMGDALMEKLGAIAKDYGQARNHRRKVLANLENEIFVQAKKCSKSTDGIHRDLKRLKKVGKDVVRSQS